MWKCRAIRSLAAKIAIKSSVTSIGSTELTRRRSTGVSSRMRRNTSPSSRARREIAPVVAEIDSAEHHFPRAAVAQLADFFDHAAGREAPAAPAHLRDHAVGAALVAPVLNFQHGARVTRLAAFDGSDEQFALLQNIASQNFCRAAARAKAISPAIIERGTNPWPVAGGESGAISRPHLLPHLSLE